MKKRILSVIMCLFLIVSAAGCGLQNKAVFHISGQDLSYEQTLTFGYILAMEYNLTDASLLEEQYDGDFTYGEYYKQLLKEDIVNTMLLYNEAKDKKINLTSEEKKAYKDSAEKLINYYGENILETRGIETADVMDIYEMKAYSEKYLKSLYEDAKEDVSEETERYVRVFQVAFSTAALDDLGNYKLDEDGEVFMLDEAAALKQKENASEFSERAKNGEDMKMLLKEYDETVTGAEKYLKYKDLSADYKKAVDGLSVGKVSNPITFDYGFFVIKLLEQDGLYYAKALSDHDMATAIDEKEKEEIKRLYDKEIGNYTEYIEDDWDQITINMFVK